MLIHEALGMIVLQSAIDGLLKNDSEALRIQETIYTLADKELQPINL